ncbi:alcohol dehydrogenase catalytic domain-containing protein (plasmid) [Rhizobium grahamii]|uniref:Alcohol dehydrogenase catalytic domain-containing protein n=1 Tax=Rhizobium grahamii TaxID=1120045 RepID=A0A5Q0CG56_9HYPH|nr:MULTISPECIES: alcohol dehydrogenase [Rhizobium]QFY62987.1 alcohol dehydrogenase catalytic domain-containing protein [Rhizobium grahamii]QRM52257.1 alcohol dehydrogenase catalytic domain-containing protein [Rhizobium sp. BG6]
MPNMRAVEVKNAKGSLQLVERQIPSPAAGQVLIKVQACGVCHSDAFTVMGAFPGIAYPRVPGHEVVGVIEKVGERVPNWKAGQRVGVGWHGGHCGHCSSCRRGDFVTCENAQIPGISYDGGYAEYMIAPFEALAAIPDELDAAEAAPLLCAGITTFNALRNSGVRPGDTVAVLGIGGLGHLGVQFAAKMGCRTVAIARGADKEPLARELGAHVYIDSTTKDVAAELSKIGGASIILSTVTNSQAMNAALGGLAVGGKMIVVGVSSDPIEVSPLLLISGRRGIQGWPSGTSSDSEDTLAFSALSDIRPMIETMPLERAAEAYERMMSGAARFRMVVTTGK